MKTLRNITLGLLCAGWAAVSPLAAAPATSDLLQQGLYAEEVEGNLNAAIKNYAQIIQSASAPENLVAQALYRQGMCYLKIKEEAAARTALEKLVAEHASQTELVEKARVVLDDLTDFDPATLMPPGTLVYAEVGSPGRQIETILNMLKGTPYENPLAAFGKGQPGQKTPGDIMGALLNPSMMAEFKKIRGLAVGVTDLAQNHPPTVAVLYPGKSDALRGLVMAGLGMVGTPDAAISGMPTLKLPGSAKVAYDDRVIILAQPASQLEWCVKQYKGLSAEPTLASHNQSFAQLDKGQRQKNVLTLWAKADDVYARLLKMFPNGKLPKEIVAANVFCDFANLDEIILTESVETTGLGSRTEIQFKQGHHCLAYDLIRTPNLRSAALEAVPAEAVALASFSLKQADGIQAAQVRNQIQNVTGLDVGRELFANLEQVTLFVLPAKGSTMGRKIPDILQEQLGLVLTSRNPEQTRQVLATLLGTIRPGENAQPGQFKIGVQGQRELNCYLEQVKGFTLLALNRDVVQAAQAALKSRQSVCQAGPLNRAVSQLKADASKLILVNAGGAMRLAGPQGNFAALDDAQRQQLATNYEQLALALDRTTVELGTEEQLNHFVVNSSLTGVPPLNDLLGPITQLEELYRLAGQRTVAKQLRQESAATIHPATTPPVVDGKAEECWLAAPAYPLDNVIEESPDKELKPAAEYRAMWDKNNLYLLVTVTDHHLRHDAEVSWQHNDGIELYLDATNGKSDMFGPTDYQYTFNWDRTAPEMQERKHNQTNGVQYALVTTDKGYCVEVKIPWATLGGQPAAGGRIGLEVQVNDNQGGVRRAAKIAWHDGEDQAWKSPQAFGNAELGGLVGWWKFDETQGTQAADSSGGNHHGSLVGKAQWAPGKQGGALRLDGQGSFVRIGDKSAFDLTGAVTIAAWVNMHAVPAAWMAIVSKGDNAWRLSTLEQERKFHFPINEVPYTVAVNSTTTVNADAWHHVAAVYDGATARLYVDGQLEATGTGKGAIKSNDFDVLIGENAGVPGRCFDGLLDDVRVYNYAVPERQIKALAVGQP